MCGWVDAAPSRRRLLKCCLMPGRSADRTAQGFTVDSKPAKHEVLIRRPIVLYGAAFLLRDAGACRDQHINGQCLIYGELERGGGRLRGKTVYTDQFTEVINHRLTGKGDQILLCCLLYRNPDQHFAIGPQINQQTFCLCRVQRFAGIRFILRNHFCRDFVGIAFNKIGFCQRHSSS